MHTYFSGGVAGTELAALLTVLKGEGVAVKSLQAYVGRWKVSKARQNPNVKCLEVHENGDDQMKCFASELLAFLPIIGKFLDDVVVPLGLLDRHVKCYKHLL